MTIKASLLSGRSKFGPNIVFQDTYLNLKIFLVPCKVQIFWSFFMIIIVYRKL